MRWSISGTEQGKAYGYTCEKAKRLSRKLDNWKWRWTVKIFAEDQNKAW